jgi:protein-tyrosine phosphatase
VKFLHKQDFALFGVLLLVGCAAERPLINSVCELQSNGAYSLKWETFPPLAGNVKIYASDSPDSFNLSSPISNEDIAKGYSRVLPMPMSRTYFQLLFNDAFPVVTANRVIPFQRIVNFRDLGGYVNNHGQTMRWGKIYRSGSLAAASEQDLNELRRLHIQTVIDLRTEDAISAHPNKFLAPKVVYLPLRGNRYDTLFDTEALGKMTQADVMAYDLDVFSFLMENNVDYFAQMFQVLLDEQNYPIVIYGFLGKDRVAAAVVLLFEALEMSEKVFVDDFLLSNELLDFRSIFKNADEFSPEVQETMTALLRSHEETILQTRAYMNAKYGSAHNYLEKELKLTPQDRDRLKQILLYSHTPKSANRNSGQSN